MKYSRKFNDQKGSASLEACIVLPMFCFLLLFFYGFIVFFSGQQAIDHALVQSAESLSLDPYAIERLGEGEIETGGDIVRTLYSGIVSSNEPGFSSNKKWYAGDTDLMHKTIEKRFLSFLAGDSKSGNSTADKILKNYGVEGGVAGLNLSSSEIVDGELKIVLKYRQNFIFDFWGLLGMDLEKTVYINLWDTAE